MKDLVTRRSKQLDVTHVLEAIKERLVESRFNIDDYDIKAGSIHGRRNNLDKVVLGLYKKVTVKVDKVDDEISVELKWGGLISSASISAIQFFIVSFAIFRNLDFRGFLIALLIGVLGVCLNLVAFVALRGRLVSKIKRDLADLEQAAKQKKRTARMDGF